MSRNRARPGHVLAGRRRVSASVNGLRRKLSGDQLVPRYVTGSPKDESAVVGHTPARHSPATAGRRGALFSSNESLFHFEPPHRRPGSRGYRKHCSPGRATNMVGKGAGAELRGGHGLPRSGRRKAARIVNLNGVVGGASDITPVEGDVFRAKSARRPPDKPVTGGSGARRRGRWSRVGAEAAAWE